MNPFKLCAGKPKGDDEQCQTRRPREIVVGNPDHELREPHRPRESPLIFSRPYVEGTVGIRSTLNASPPTRNPPVWDEEMGMERNPAITQNGPSPRVARRRYTPAQGGGYPFWHDDVPKGMSRNQYKKLEKSKPKNKSMKVWIRENKKNMKKFTKKNMKRSTKNKYKRSTKRKKSKK